MIGLLLMLTLFAQEPDCRSCPTLSHMASTLSEGDPVKFMQYLDKSMPGYEELRMNVEALTAQNDVACSLDVLRESEDNDRLTALVDWFVQLASKDGTGHVVRRRMQVEVTEQKTKGRWKVTNIEPRGILDPVGP